MKEFRVSSLSSAAEQRRLAVTIGVVELKEQLVVEEVDGEGQEGKVKEEGRDRVKEKRAMDDMEMTI